MNPMRTRFLGIFRYKTAVQARHIAIATRRSTDLASYVEQSDYVSRYFVYPKSRSPSLLLFRLNSTGSKVEPFILADIGEGINEVVIKGWQVKVGDVVKEFDPICEVESDKATATISSRFDGVITKVHYELGDMAKVGKPLVDIEVAHSGSIDTTMKSSKPQISSESLSSLPNLTSTSRPSNEAIDRPISALPSIRRLAAQNGVDLSKVEATGRNGRITREDLDNYMRGAKLEKETNQSAPKTGRTSSQTSERVPMNSIQKAMYKTMTEALKIPHFNYSDEIDMTRLVEVAKLRNLQNTADSGEEKISNFAIFVKMVSLALQSYPQLNASVDHERECLVVKNYHNIGIAVDTPNGLIVPNVKNVQDLSIRQVHLEIIRLRDLAYNSKLGPSDLSGGTVSLSNIGAIGGIFGVPVIVPPEIIIGALGRTRVLPRFGPGGDVQARHIMQVVWSADHRIVDGATLCRFSNLLRQYLEQPEKALVEMS